MVQRFLVPLFLFLVLAAGIVFALRSTRRGGEQPATPRITSANLWEYLRFAAQNPSYAYGDDAVEAAGELPGTDAEGILEFGLSRHADAYEDDNRAIRALFVLAGRGAPGIVGRIVKCVEEGGEPFVGEWAARALARVASPDATAALVKLSRSDDFDARRGAVLALAPRGEAAAREALEVRLKDEDEEIGAAAAGALAAFEDRDGLAAAEDFFAKEDDAVDSALALGLGAAANPAARPWLERLLARPAPDVRAAAARAFASFGDKAPSDVLKQLLADPNPDVRLAAAVALARALKSDAGAEELVRAANSEPDLDLRVEALRAIASLRRAKDRRMFETFVLVAADDEPHRRMRIWASAALLALGVR